MSPSSSHEHGDLGIPKNLTHRDVSNFNLIIDHVIGNKKQPRKDVFIPMGGIPQMPLTREEIFIRNIFDSCAFKSTASGVVGKSCPEFSKARMWVSLLLNVPRI